MAPVIRLIAAEAFERPVRFRMPFRFGAARVEGTAQAFLRVRIADSAGREAFGWSAEMMMPKWFDKAPELSAEDNIDQLRRSLRLAMEAMLAAGSGTTFGLHAATEAQHHAVCLKENLNPLIASFGLALVDRAIIDALSRMDGVTAADAVRANLFGIDAATAPDLKSFDFSGFLAVRPAPQSIAIRHTIGLGDALTDGEIGAPIGDGLPESLTQVMSRYGHSWFKIKVSGQPEADVARLVRIAAVLDGLPDYRLTLDGNEQFTEAAGVIDLLDRMAAEPGLARFRKAIAFIEQPIARGKTLSTDVSAIAARVPLEIDESDGFVGAFPEAVALGYSGISSKSCKGFYRALINAARVAIGHNLFLSAEDLTTQAGIGLQQDLVLASLVGATHVERNGHHYVDGMAGVSPIEQRAYLERHGDLYEASAGHARLDIRDGLVSLRSVLGAVGLGSAVEPDWAAMAQMQRAA